MVARACPTSRTARLGAVFLCVFFFVAYRQTQRASTTASPVWRGLPPALASSRAGAGGAAIGRESGIAIRGGSSAGSSTVPGWAPAESGLQERIAALLESNRKLHSQLLLSDPMRAEGARKRTLRLYQTGWEKVRGFHAAAGGGDELGGEALPGGLSLLPTANDALVVGYCDDPMQYFAQEVSRYIAPWRPLKLVLVPHLGKQMTTRAVRDSRFDGRQAPSKHFPHILMCQGWHYDHKLKTTRKGSPSRDAPEGYPLDTWVDGVYWPKSSQFRTHRARRRPLLIAASMEARGGRNCDQYDLLLDTKSAPLHGGCPTLYTPMAAVGLSDHVLRGPEDLVQPHDFDARAVLEAKKGFCAFLYRTCFKDFYGNFAAVRGAFFDILAAEHKSPTALGGCKRGRGPDPKLRPDGGHGKHSYMDEAVEMFSSYKFTITFENSRVPGYITEKIVNAALANTVPIYLGAPDIEDFVNPKRFIHCKIDDAKLRAFNRRKFSSNDEREQYVLREFTGLRECARRVKEVDESDDLYLDMLSQPILHNNVLEESIFDYAYYGRRIRRILKLYDSDVLRGEGSRHEYV